MSQQFKILLIEDDIDSLEILRQELLAHDYEVLTAANGVEGLRRAQAEEPDLLILDVMLPGLDGFEVCHRLKAMPQTAELPIIMLSAKVQEDDKSTGLKVGANKYLTKPVDLSELVACVEQLLAKKSPISPTKRTAVAFIGSKGGVGTSTVVVNIAIALAQGGSSVILIDLCPYFGTVPLLLGLQPEHATSSDIFNSSSGLEALLITHESGIRVLLSPQTAEDYRKIGPSDVGNLLEQLRTMAQYLLINIPAHPSNITEAALTKCDLVAVVARSSPGSLSSIDSTTSLLTKLGIERERLRIVLIESGEPSQMDFKVEIPLLGIIPYDAKGCFEGEERRIPIILAEPNSAMASALRELAHRIVGDITLDQ
jgi:CheY-like chemotaxis protein/MinD-like ATPase involved in chromosome partitioning or flagellar assembly